MVFLSFQWCASSIAHFTLQSTFKFCSTNPDFTTLPLTIQAAEFTSSWKLFGLLYQLESLLGNIAWSMRHCTLFLKYEPSLRFLARFSLFFLVAKAFYFRFLRLLPQSWNRKYCSLYLNWQCFSKPSKPSAQTQLKRMFC